MVMSWSQEIAMYFLSTIAALLPIVNPLSTVGMLMAISADMSEAERHRQVRRD
jgi:small neutral amino acid transporter SnatA (MarC family)